MKTTHTLRSIVSAAFFCLAASVHAQDLIITNARILDGKGGVIANGSVVVRDGRITAVAAGTQTVAGVQSIDAGGKTVMPGFVDGHRHVISGSPASWLAERAPLQMQEFLDAGFTTVLAAIDPPPIIEALPTQPFVEDPYAAPEPMPLPELLPDPIPFPDGVPDSRP